MKTVMLLYGG